MKPDHLEENKITASRSRSSDTHRCRSRTDAYLLINHGNLFDEIDCVLRAFLLADSAPMHRPPILGNVPSGSDREYGDWLNLSAMDDTGYTA